MAEFSTGAGPVHSPGRTGRTAGNLASTAIATDAVAPAAVRDGPVREGGLAMNETMICAVGNVATQPVFRQVVNGGSLRFRLAVTARYWDREKSAWTDGHTNFFTVWANRQLATNASGSLAVGDPVVVQGRLKVRTDVREGQSRTSADIDAVAIGHDLARGTAAFRRTGRAEASTSPPQPEPNWEVPAGETPGESPGESSGGPVGERAGESVAQPAAPATPEQRPEPVPVG